MRLGLLIRDRWAALLGQKPLKKIHFCPTCDESVDYISCRQLADWHEQVRDAPWAAPVIVHSCGTWLRCEEPRPTTLPELIGETR